MTVSPRASSLSEVSFVRSMNVGTGLEFVELVVYGVVFDIIVLLEPAPFRGTYVWYLAVSPPDIRSTSSRAASILLPGLRGQYTRQQYSLVQSSIETYLSSFMGSLLAPLQSA
jgi:hypothetical protein